MMNKHLCGGAALLTLGLALPASAHDENPGDGPGRHARERGPNPEMMKKHFAEADTDKSGTLSLKEMQEEAMDRIEKRFQEMDTNNDGEISRDEFKPRPRGEGPRKGKRPPGEDESGDKPDEA